MATQIQDMLAHCRRICIVKPDALGDFLLALPSLCALRRQHPDAHITLLTSPVVYPLAACFHVADVLLPVPLFTRQGVQAQDVQLAAQAVLTLSGGGFDATVLLRWDLDHYAAAPLVYALNSPVRLSYAAACNAQKLARAPAFDSFFTHTVTDASAGHEVLKNCALLGLEPAAPDWRVAEATLRTGRQTPGAAAAYPAWGRPCLALGLSASLAQKKLSLERWSAVIAELQRSTALPLVLLGGPEDRDFAAQLAAATGAWNACGRLNFAETFALLRSAVGMVCVDSFAKHAAALVGVPVVELSCQSAQGDPWAEYGGLRFGAWGVPTRVVKPPVPAGRCPVDACAANAPHCTQGIDAHAVAQACVALFGLATPQGAAPLQARSE